MARMLETDVQKFQQKIRLMCWRQMSRKFKNTAHVLETDVQRIQKYGSHARDRCPEITEEE
ncbi:13067_t:CDS:1, partial [Cetraspora pellucida]